MLWHISLVLDSMQLIITLENTLIWIWFLFSLISYRTEILFKEPLFRFLLLFNNQTLLHHNTHSQTKTTNRGVSCRHHWAKGKVAPPWNRIQSFNCKWLPLVAKVRIVCKTHIQILMSLMFPPHHNIWWIKCQKNSKYSKNYCFSVY